MSIPPTRPKRDKVLWWLALAVALTLLILGWLDWTVYRSYRSSASISEAAQIQELRGQILLLDEILTMSARMATVTGDPKWEERYIRFAPQLDKGLQEAIHRVSALGERQGAVRTDAANTGLVRMEERAFELVRQGQREAAQQLLASPEYEIQKVVYSEGMAEINELLKQDIGMLRAQQESQMPRTMTRAAILTLVLIICWWLVLKAVRQWRDTLKKRNVELRKQKEALQQASDAMLQRVIEREQAEEALQRSLHEKETLLREIHHRVKNNLQIISSLLHFQSKKARDGHDLAIFLEGQDRLRAMILVHEHLYRSPDLHSIDFAKYVRTLTEELHRSFGDAARRIGLDLQTDEFFVPAEIAMPCGMIVTELITNAHKYAYPPGESGLVGVHVTKRESSFTISVSDTGAGLPAEFDPARATSFGMQLVHNLTLQLRGTLTWGPGTGTVILVEVPLNARPARAPEFAGLKNGSTARAEDPRITVRTP